MEVEDNKSSSDPDAFDIGRRGSQGSVPLRSLSPRPSGNNIYISATPNASQAFLRSASHGDPPVTY